MHDAESTILRIERTICFISEYGQGTDVNYQRSNLTRISPMSIKIALSILWANYSSKLSQEKCSMHIIKFYLHSLNGREQDNEYINLQLLKLALGIYYSFHSIHVLAHKKL